jgi:hypothetical protein
MLDVWIESAVPRAALCRSRDLKFIVVEEASVDISGEIPVLKPTGVTRRFSKRQNGAWVEVGSCQMRGACLSFDPVRFWAKFFR